MEETVTITRSLYDELMTSKKAFDLINGTKPVYSFMIPHHIGDYKVCVYGSDEMQSHFEKLLQQLADSKKENDADWELYRLQLRGLKIKEEIIDEYIKKNIKAPKLNYKKDTRNLWQRILNK
jgi:hypothetical protein